MSVFILRNGKSLPADEAFHAWTSGDLPRMVAACSLATHPIDRHFLLMGIVCQTYSRRDDPKMRQLCLRTGRRHLAEFASIAPVLADDMGGSLPRVPTFAHLATLLAEDDLFDEGVAVCEKAMTFGLHDGTKGDYPARIERIRKAAAKTRPPAV